MTSTKTEQKQHLWTYYEELEHGGCDTAEEAVIAWIDDEREFGVMDATIYEWERVPDDDVRAVADNLAVRLVEELEEHYQECPTGTFKSLKPKVSDLVHQAVRDSWDPYVMTRTFDASSVFPEEEWLEMLAKSDEELK